MTEVVVEEVESPMKITVVENENSRSKQNPKKRVGEEDDETLASQQNATKKTKGCKSMLMVDFLKEHNELDDEELEKWENEDDDEDELENEDQEEENNGTIKNKTRGPTQCLKIHGRQFEEREEIILDDDGEPVGPTEKVLTGLSNFPGTIAKSSAFCPLIYTNFKGIVKNDEKDEIWGYVQNLRKKNIVNRAKQRFNHRMGPKNFATIRKKLREKKGNGEDATQAEMFIETRQCRKGKKNEETETAISKLQEAIQNPSQPPDQVFRSLFGKEKSGKIRCYGKTATPSMLKKKEEIATIKKQYEGEISSMKEKMEAHESLTQKKMEAYESLLKCVMMQQNPNLSEDDVNNMMGQALGIESVIHHSSTSTYIPEKGSN
ncbi:hypothetical protein TSUD_401980 [Trifolium subterraneum]|uniref:Transposase Tnp1/En/Spm-like domain-containing protein n=1 Tax=Trifolium subterraneum TaxID=3900 RepID=A0A2Z6PJH4_TRISU|nr:hypothetical protein TSUD_401980 [Trifolium subterraneum]